MEILDEQPENRLQYATFTDRLLAYLVDGILIALAGWALRIVLGVNVFSGSYGLIWFGNISTLVYFILMEGGKNNATLGKMILRIRVVDIHGERIGYEKAAVRNLCKILSAVILLIGFIMVAFSDKKQGLHDKLAQTLVVKDETK